MDFSSTLRTASEPTELDLDPSVSASSSVSSRVSSAAPNSVPFSDATLASLSLYRPKPLWQRLDIVPFVFLYAVLFYFAAPTFSYEFDQFSKARQDTAEVAASGLAFAQEFLKNTTSIDSDDLQLNIQSDDDELSSSSSSLSSSVSSPLTSINYIAFFSTPFFLFFHVAIFLLSYWNVKAAAKIKYTQEKFDFQSAKEELKKFQSTLPPPQQQQQPAPAQQAGPNRGARAPVRPAPVPPAPVPPLWLCVFPASQLATPSFVSLSSVSWSDSKGAKIETLEFTFQKVKFLWDPEKSAFVALEYRISEPLSFYLQGAGLSTASAVQSTRSRYGPNQFDIPLPPFMELFQEHAMAPFFVFQVFCVLLWCLDEYWYYSLMTLFMLVSFECTVVQRRLKHLQYLRDMRVPPYQLHVYRESRWTQISSSELLPGDIVSMTRTVGDSVCPADLLLISGSAVVNEALLTGESIPQVKESVDSLNESEVFNLSADHPNGKLAINKSHKQHILFGGTKLLMTSDSRAQAQIFSPAACSIKSPPDGGCICYVLRTGFATNQGKLVRTILFNSERMTVNNTESLLFIGFLLIFALAASGYVLMHGLEDPNRSRYKLLLNCIMIITSVVPPELPMELSLAVNNSLMQLAQQQIFCTEPFRIPLAGAIDVCCFDKTGTLTSEEFQVKGIAKSKLAAVKNDSSESSAAAPEGAFELVSATETDFSTKIILAGCHSLVRMEGSLVGDPLEKACFRSINWAVSKNESALNNADPKEKIRILQRYAFSSQLKRMSTIIALENPANNGEIRVVTKGAAEVLADRFRSLPPNYDSICAHYSRLGARVLALGYKILPFRDDNTEHRKLLRALTRDEIESGLEFAGFLVLECPLKPHSKETIEHLLHSSHGVIMITGDNALTAASVATELKIATKPVLVAKLAREGHGHSAGPVVWESIQEPVERFPFRIEESDLITLALRFDFCLSGDAFEHLIRLHRSASALAQLRVFIEYVSIFARASPDQKEFVIAQLKAAGHITLMEGDGSNDAASLRQAHIGVSLIGEDQVQGPAGNSIDTEEKRVEKKEKPVAPTFQQLSQMPFQERMAAMKKFQEDMKSFADEAPQIRLGDASLASSFVSKVPYINSTIGILRQGRCTLVTTLQMFNILGINCLISAYSMSVLYLDGVKMGDTQMTASGLLIAILFLFLSRTKPVDKLSKQRPERAIFTVPMLLSILCQFGIHLTVLLTAIDWSNPHTPQDKEHRSPEAKFQPNVLNTVVYLVSTAATCITFAVNYRGRPFMENLKENRTLYTGLKIAAVSIIFLALEISPELNEFLQLHPLPSPEFRVQLVSLIVGDYLATVGVTKLIKAVFKQKDIPVLKRHKLEHAKQNNGKAKSE